MLTTGSWDHRRVWVCAQVQEVESQEVLGVCSGIGSWNHRRDRDVCSQQEVESQGDLCSQQEVESQEGSRCVLRYRKLESQEGCECVLTTGSGITGGSGCVLTTGSWNHRRVWVVLGVQMQMCFCSGQFPQDLDMQLERY